MAVVSTLAVDLTLRSASFGRGIRAAQNQLSGFVRFTQTVNRSLGRLGALIGIGGAGGAVAAMTRLVTAGIRWGDALDDMSQRTGIAIKDLATLQRVAATSGVSFDTLATSIQLMQRTISRAGSGDASVGRLFRSLRLDIESLKRLNAFDQFVRIASAIRKIGNEADRIRAMQAVFGRGGGLLAGIIAGGSRELSKAAADIERLNAALSATDAKRLSKIADAWNSLWTATTGLGAQAALALDIEGTLLGWSFAIGKLSKSIEEFNKVSTAGKKNVGGQTSRAGSPFGLPGVRGDFQRFTPQAPFGAANKFLVDNMFMPIPFGKGTMPLAKLAPMIERGRHLRELEDKAGEANKVIENIIPDFGDAVEETTKAIRHAVVGTFGAKLAQEIGAPTSGSALPTLPALSRSGRVEESQLEVQRGMLQCLKDIRRQSQDDEILN